MVRWRIIKSCEAVVSKSEGVYVQPLHPTLLSLSMSCGWVEVIDAMGNQAIAFLCAEMKTK